MLARALTAIGIIFAAVITINFQNVIKTQPRKIDMVPIVNFLERDNHTQWRYLTLGFGDQMAWLSANTRPIPIKIQSHMKDFEARKSSVQSETLFVVVLIFWINGFMPSNNLCLYCKVTLTLAITKHE